MKRILLSLIIAAPLCAMQPEKKIELNNTVKQVATGISFYNAFKPMDIGIVDCITAGPSRFPLVATTYVMYRGTKIAYDMYQKSYATEENKK